MVKKCIYRLLAVLVAILIASQPLSVPIVQAAEANRDQRLASIAAAERLGVAADFLLNPDAYLADQERSAVIRRDAALAQLDQAYRPSILALALVKAQAETVKDVQAQSALGGIAPTLTNLDQLVTQAQTNLAQGHTPNREPFTAFVTAITAALADVDRAEQLARAEAIGPAQDNVAEFFAAVHPQLNALRQLLTHIPDRSASADEWRTYLQHFRADLPAQPVTSPSLTGLPISPLSARPRAPHTSRLDYARDERLLPTLNDLITYPLQSIQAWLMTIGLPSGPSPADLTETPDVHFTSDIRTLVSNFHSDPVALFNFVHDNIDFDVYYGSKKGSTGTLYEMAGNDVDQTSLLIALLRAANIPARYATGRVWLSAQQAQDLTRTTDTHAAADALTSGGIPAIYVTRPGTDPVVEIEHTWVQAWLPYEQYRGVLEKPGASSWIDLDPSIKRYTFNTPVDLRNAVTFNPDSFLSAITTTLPVDVWENNLRAYIQANALECQDFATASRTRTIVPDNLELLPAQLPALQLNTLATLSQLLATQRYGINVQLTDDQGNAEINFNADLPAIYGQRLDLRFPAATSADQATINSYGGLFNTPAYMINLSPTLSLSETVVAVGNPLRPGAARSLVATFSVPGLTSDVNQISHQTLAGGVYVLGLDYQSAPQRLIDEAQTRLTALNNVGGDNAAAQRLYIALLTYFRQFNHGRDDVTGILQAGFIRDVGAGFADQQVKVASLYGAPTALSAGAYFLDVPKLSFTFYDLEGGQSRAAQVATLVGYNSSALEHEVWQQQFAQESISAVKALQLAASQGQTLYTISDASQVATLNVDPSIKAAILDALNRGWLAKVSQSSITLNQWTGAGYILYDPTLGSAGYLISGGLSGGSTTGGGSGQGSNCGQGAPAACGGSRSYLDAIQNVITSIVGDPVNLSNGNYLITQTDLSVRARRLPIRFTRWYNSLSPTDGRLGWGWTDSFSLRIVDNGDGARDFVDADGHTYHFMPDGSGGFIRPAGLHLTLTSSGTGYVMSDALGNVQTFNTSGQLTSTDDTSGNLYTLNYSGGQLASVSDPINRTVLSFAYNGSGRIATVTDVDHRQVQYGYDAVGNLTTVTDVTNAVTAYTYDSHHRLTSITDPIGATNTYLYDADGRMQRHIDPLGNIESFSYDLYNGRAVMTDAAGHDTLYTFDDRGRPTSSTDALGNRIVNQWDADDNPVQTIDARGHVTSATFDANGNVIATVNALGQTTNYIYNARGELTNQTQVISGTTVEASWSYDSQGNLTTHTDGANHTTTLGYDGNGQVTSATNPDGGLTTYTYNVDGSVSQIAQTVHDANGSVTTLTKQYAYAAGGFLRQIEDGSARTFAVTQDAAGRVQTVTGPGGGNQATLHYDTDGRLTQLTYRNGYTVTYTYDPLGRLTQESNSLNQTIYQTYNSTGQLIARTDARGQTTRYQYDELGRLMRTINPDGSISGVAYCANSSQPCQMVDENGFVTQITHDALGRATAEADPLSNSVSRVYDEAGQLLSQIDAAGHTTSYRYDAPGDLAQVVDALNNLTRYSYDNGLNLSGITDANNHSRAYVYDEVGQLTRVTDADNNLTRYFYDGAGRKNQIIDANGNTLSYAYDSTGWLTGISGPSGATTFVNDTSGRVTTQSNADTTLNDSYTTNGYLLSSTQQISGVGKSVQYTYTPSNQIESITDAEGRVTRYAYDARDRLSTIIAPDGSQTTFAYDPAGRRIRLGLPNGITTYYTYDAADRLTAQMSRRSDGTLVAAYSYTYDPSGHRTSLKDVSGGTTAYTYDALYRLTNVTYGNGRTQSFTYDAVGNRLSQTVDGVTTTYTYDPADRLTSETTNGQTTTYRYDHNGNLISRVTGSANTTFTYNHFNQLNGIALADGSSYAFGYAPDGNRVYETHTPVIGPAQRTDFLLSHASVLTDYSAAGTTHYLLGPWSDELLAQETGGTWTYYIQDGTNSAAVATDATGQVVARRTYDAFGSVLDQLGTWPARYTFTGREAIGLTGLLYYRARTYDSSTGRFTSVDPVFGELLDPMTLQRYSYVQNDPINLRDPSGQQKKFFYPYYRSFLEDADSTSMTWSLFILGLFDDAANEATFEQLYDGMIASLMDLLYYQDFAVIPNNSYGIAWVVALFVPVGFLELYGGYKIKQYIHYRDLVSGLLAVGLTRAQQHQQLDPPYLYQPWASVIFGIQSDYDSQNDTSPSNYLTYNLGDSLYLISPEFALGFTSNLK